MRECLDNVRHLLDAIVIDDTGSSDNTVDIIERYCEENKIPASVRVVPWKDFGHNRTQAIRHAEKFLSLPYADDIRGVKSIESKSNDIWYLLFMDADNHLHVDSTPPESTSKNGSSKESKEGKEDKYYINKNNLGADVISIDMTQSVVRYDYQWLIRLDPSGVKRWKWWYPCHEYIGPMDPDTKISKTHLKGAYIFSGRTGARSRDPLRYLADALSFERYLIDNPNDARATFYLAQSYRDCNKLHDAYETYLKRGLMDNGWIEEKYVALLNASELARKLFPDDEHKMLDPCFRAADIRRERVEASVAIINYHIEKKSFYMGWLLAKEYLNMEKPPKNTLFMDIDCYEWKIFQYAGICAVKCGFKDKAKDCFRRALRSKRLSEKTRSDIETALKEC